MSMLTALLLATALYPTLAPLTGTGSLGSGSGVTQFTFLVAGDNRPDSGDNPSDGFIAMVAAMQKVSPAPAFVLWGGDTIKGKKKSNAQTQYPLVLPYFQKIGVPVFNVPGNHEGDKSGSGKCHDAADTSGDLLTYYTKYLGPKPYGYFTYGNSAFIGVNTEDLLGNVDPPKGCFNGFVSKSQLQALQATIAQLQQNTSIENIFLFMHRPTQDDNDHKMEPDSKDQDTKYGKKVVEFTSYINGLTSGSKVAIVFASHDHRFYEVPVSGKPAFFVTGGAGAPLSGCPDSPNSGAYYHYLQVTVDGGHIGVKTVPLTDTTPCGAPPASAP
jgi:hypothetical protein